MFRSLVPPLLLALSAPAIAGGHQERAATAEVVNKEGDVVGTVAIDRTASGAALVTLDLTGIPEGVHGVHLHETGDCSADDFSSAGGHIAGDANHGILAEGGPHPGDLPNTIAGAEGAMKVEYFNARLDIDAHIMDEDGAAFIVHSGADDYTSQPAGDAGDPIACGVFKPG